jgi:hypothetical protein
VKERIFSDENLQEFYIKVDVIRLKIYRNAFLRGVTFFFSAAKMYLNRFFFTLQLHESLLVIPVYNVYVCV